jgi:hypothetical protein
MRGYALLAMGMAFGSLACNGSAKAKLELHNATATTASGLTGSSAGGLKLETVTVTPQSTTYFAMKLSNVSLVPDVDPVTQNNIGEVTELWVAPSCTSADDCPFFDFARPSFEVNAELNSQARDVTPGSYRYVRVTFCKDGDKPTKPNIEWSGGDVTGKQGILEEFCAVTSSEYDPPIVLQAGDTVSVALGYDLAGATQVMETGPGDGSHGTGYSGGLYFDQCLVDSPTTQTCFTIPKFTPAAMPNGGAGDPVGEHDEDGGDSGSTGG